MITRSHCPAWSSAPTYFLGREILDVRRLAPRWTQAEIAPVPSGLSRAKGSVPHPAGGKIDVSWKLDAAKQSFQCFRGKGLSHVETSTW
ncbi:hypothetical protein [Paenibacillus sp. LjRoot56]|uniref:hypothetical protein n=1 Tax=Paenibacillus sp. LjRoot56 TaxID=3342333 RepID=UPI003ECF79C6